MMEIGIQLYSYSGTELSFEEKLRHAAQAGYSGVEFAGDYGGMTAPELRSRLLSLGLWTRSAHVGLDRIGPELPFLAELGVRYVICPYCVFPDMDAVCRVAQRLNTLGEYAKQYGIRTGFHNHIDEFYKLDGTYILDHLLALTDPALVSFQLDCGWAACAGVSPEAYLAEHAGRFVSIHIKENLRRAGSSRRRKRMRAGRPFAMPMSKWGPEMWTGARSLRRRCGRIRIPYSSWSARAHMRKRPRPSASPRMSHG